MRVAPTLLALLAVVAATACSSETAEQAPSAGSADYLAAVDELLAPPSRLAALTADRLAGRAGTTSDVPALIVSARRERDEFGALRLEASELRVQRDGLLDGYAAVLAAMEPLVAAHAAADDAALSAPARDFYAALEALPASVPPPGSG